MNDELSSTSYRPIEDYGLIGNCHSAALVSSQGSIDWLCLPRFDSPSLFARILDVDKGGFWSIRPTLACESVHKYVEHTNVLETTFNCDTGKVVLRDFMYVDLEKPSSPIYHPSRLVRILECTEGTADIICRCAPRPDYARSLPLFDIDGSRAIFGPYQMISPSTWRIDHMNREIYADVRMAAGEKVSFILGVQYDPELLQFSPYEGLRSTLSFWKDWVDKCTYHGPYREEVLRSVLTLKLMTYNPSGAIIASPTTSLPETIGGERNWDYRLNWIRDASFTLYALMLSGYMDYAKPFFDWIVHTVELEGTGIRILYPIIHENNPTETTLDHLRGYRDSRPVRIGNAAYQQEQLDVYGEVISAIHFAWHIGSYDPHTMWPQIRGILDWAADHWHEPDNGIWEVRGGVRHFVHSKAMLWSALEQGSEMALKIGLPGNVTKWRHEQDLIKAEVLEKGWSESLGAFKQSYEDETLDASNLILPTIGFIDGKDPRMVSTIDATLKHLVIDGLCYRYSSAPEGVSGKEGSFVLCTFLVGGCADQGGTVE